MATTKEVIELDGVHCLLYQSRFKKKIIPIDIAEEETARRLAYLEQILPPIKGRYKSLGGEGVVTVVGSVAFGAADHKSDVDLTVYLSNPSAFIISRKAWSAVRTEVGNGSLIGDPAKFEYRLNLFDVFEK
jgi:hypothetical protein